MNFRSGFTLVECVVSCLIVCTIFCFSVPAYTVMKDRAIFRAEVEEMITCFFVARQEAIKRNCPVVLKFSDIGYRVFVDDSRDGYGDWIRQAGETVLVEKNLPDTVSLATTFTGKRTRFNGVPNVKAGSVILAADDGRKTKIVMNIAGRIRTQQIN